MSPTASVVVIVVGIVGTLAVMPIVIRLAVLSGLQDEPGGYKKHERPTPLLGGLGLFAGMALAMLASGENLSPLGLPALCVGFILFLGAVDDRIGLSVWIRLVCEGAVGAVLFLGDLGWNLQPLPAVGDCLLTVFWVVGISNAINIMDNLDGSLGSITVSSGIGITSVAALAGSTGASLSALSLVGASIGFLAFNLSQPAKVFLGDSGSLGVGLTLAILTMNQAPEDGAIGQVLLAVLVLALPLLDLVGVTASRLRRGVSLFQGERNHFPHVLFRQLASPRRVALALFAIQGVFCILAVLLEVKPSTVLGACALTALSAGMVVSLRIAR